MDSLNLNKHISGQFNAELESIRTQVMTMGGMVEQQLSDAITAMHNQDSELAKRVVEGDHQVNMMEVAIDEACVRIIAKRQPTASDLRLVMAIIKTIAELERIGDVADKICRTALEKFSQQHQPLLVSLESLGRHTVQMLHDVLDAFARMDLDEAVRIYREDKKVDQEYEGIVRQLMTYMMEDSLYHQMTAQDIVHFDVRPWFEKMALAQHLTPSRSQGLEAMIRAIRAKAATLS